MPVFSGPTLLAENVATGGRWASHWDATGSSDDRGISAYQWDFGDGASASGSVVDHDYTALGLFTVTLTVTDHGRQVASTTQQVEVIANDLPVAAIEVSTRTVEGTQPFRLSGASSTDDFGIFSYHWSLSPQLFTFDGPVIDPQWETSATGVSQNDRIIVTGQRVWGRTFFFNVGEPFARGAVLEARVDTDPNFSTHAMVGFKNRNFASGHYNQLVYAVYFNGGNLSVYEKGRSRGSKGSYSRGTSYDIRIETLLNIGAIYFIRPSGTGDPFSEIFSSTLHADTELSIGADVFGGAFGFDDFRISQERSGRDITAGVGATGDVTLTVADNALQEDSATVTINTLTGTPPVAVINGPASGNIGVDLFFNGFGSTDDFEIASYTWDFGDGGFRAARRRSTRRPRRPGSRPPRCFDSWSRLLGPGGSTRRLTLGDELLGDDAVTVILDELGRRPIDRQPEFVDESRAFRCVLALARLHRGDALSIARQARIEQAVEHMGRQQLGEGHRDQELRADPVGRGLAHQFVCERKAPGRRNAIDLLGRPPRLRLGRARHQPRAGELGQRRIDGAKACVVEMAEATFESFLDLIAGRVAEREDAQAKRAHVHDRSTSQRAPESCIYWSDIFRFNMPG